MELYHKWLRKGEAADDHKYTRREWRNGRWYYYYDDGTTTKDYPKGQNYKTFEQAKTEKAARDAKIAEMRNNASKTSASSKTITSMLEDQIKAGTDAISKLEYFMMSRFADLTRDKKEEPRKPIGQNYTVRKDK